MLSKILNNIVRGNVYFVCNQTKLSGRYMRPAQLTAMEDAVSTLQHQTQIVFSMN